MAFDVVKIICCPEVCGAASNIDERVVRTAIVK